MCETVVCFPGCSPQLPFAALSEAWWHAELPGRDALMPKALPLLVVQALSSGRAAEVKRVHSVRGALELFDFDDESIASLKALLLRCVFAPAFVRCAEGRRFLSGLLCLHPQLSKEVAAIVRNQLPSGRKSILESYGEVLYRAWRHAAGPCLIDLEHGCLQPLMQLALQASTPAHETQSP